MPIVDWLKRIMKEKAQDFLVAPLDEKNGAPKLSPVTRWLVTFSRRCPSQSSLRALE
jgi:hypothetical protein